jgi:hypothetical protein
MSQKRKEFTTMGMWGRKRLLALLMVSLLGPAVAWGQVLTLTPSLTIGAQYDDNIFQEDEDAEDDFITTISPGIQLRYVPRTETMLTFEYQPALNFFADNDDENFVSHRLDFDFESPLSRRFALQVSDLLVITEEPGDRIREVDDIDPNPDARPGSREARERTLRNVARVALDAGLTARTSLGLLFESLIEDVEDDDELNEFRYLLGTELGYLTDVARQNRAFLSYAATIFTFSNNCEVGDTGCSPQNDQGFTVHAITAGYEHNLSATLTAQARIGYADTVSDRDDVDGNDAIVGSIGMVKTLRTGQLAFSYDRNFTSGGGTSDQVIADRFVGRFNIRPTPKITTALAASYTFLDYEQENVSAINDDDRTFLTIRPSVQYQMLRFLGFHAAYNYSFSNYQEDVRADRTEHRLQAGAVLTIRAGLFVDLTYQYHYRSYDDTPESNRRDEEYSRNEILLSVTYRPTLRF